jgi:hypothetical protein
MVSVNQSSPRDDRAYSFLERMRAGLGAAGATAALAEGISSTRFATSILGGLAQQTAVVTLVVVTLAVAAFAVASYVVNVPASRRQDTDR